MSTYASKGVRKTIFLPLLPTDRPQQPGGAGAPAATMEVLITHTTASGA
jgi:hypothetical protein